MVYLLLALSCIVVAVVFAGGFISGAEIERMICGALATGLIYIVNLFAWVQLTKLEDVFVYIWKFGGAENAFEVVEIFLLFFVPPMLPSAIFLWRFGKRYFNWEGQSR